MIFNYSWAVWLAWILAAFFIGNGIANVIGLKPIRDGFARWGFPSWFHIANGILDIAVGAMIAWYPTRAPGLLLAALICVAVWITLIRHKEWAHLPPSVVLSVIVLLTAWGLRLI